MDSIVIGLHIAAVGIVDIIFTAEEVVDDSLVMTDIVAEVETAGEVQRSSVSEIHALLVARDKTVGRMAVKLLADDHIRTGCRRGVHLFDRCVVVVAFRSAELHVKVTVVGSIP